MILTILQLPDDIQDFVRQFNHGKSASKELLHLCKIELFHAIWSSMMDEEFICAYRDGIIVDCGDGIRRRLYPRIFTYSADYPEK